MATPAEIQRQLAAARTAKRDAEVKKQRDAISAKRERERLQAEDKRAIDALAASEKARRQRVYGKAAEADFERWQASPAGLAALTAYREKNPTRGTVGNARDEERQRRDDLAAIELFRKTFVATRINNLATADENAFYASGPAPGAAAATPPQQEVAKGAAGTTGTAAQGTQGSAAADKSLLPLPKVVVEERLRGEGVNTNLEEYERDSAGSNTGVAKATTSNQAFSVNRRQGQSFNIGRFRAEVSGADSVLPTHSFLVVFAPMPWAIQKFPIAAGNLDSILTMRCDNVVLPSINLLQEQNIRRYGFGPVENVPYGVNVGDFTLQFIVDKNAFVVQFFEEWLNKIVNRDSFGGANMNNVRPGGRKPYEIAYKDTYACSSINVFVYDRSQNNVMEYNIYDAFPTGIQSMNMSWSEENELMKLNITFSFTDVRIKQSPAKNKKEAAGAFGSSVDFQNALVNGPKMTDAELKSFLSSNPLVYAGSLTDLTKETITIGDGARTRGSVTPVQLNTAATSQTADVPVQKTVSTLNVRINPPA
jgi:hypothetical protein